MGVLDVSHRSRVKIQPLLAEDGIPTPADDEINHDYNPNREMIDLNVHKVFGLSGRREFNCKREADNGRAGCLIDTGLSMSESDGG